MKFKLKGKMFEDTEEMWKELERVGKAFLYNKPETYAIASGEEWKHLKVSEVLIINIKYFFDSMSLFKYIYTVCSKPI